MHIQCDGVDLDMGSWMGSRTAHDVSKMNLSFVNYHLTRRRDGVVGRLKSDMSQIPITAL